jgi:plasmid stabilization system protein ParE
MPLPVRFHPEVELDLTEATNYYAERSSTAWRRFADAIDAALAQIAELPLAAPAWPRRPDVRRRLVPTFPYAIIYVIERSEIYVLTVEHTRRRPDRWLRRCERRF